MVYTLLIHGPSGSGKGTQCALLADKLHGVRISTGDLLREHVKTFNDIADGTLADSSDILRLLQDALVNLPADKSVVLDGVARMPEEAKWLQAQLTEQGRPMQLVIDLYIPVEESLRRLLRRTDGRPDDDEAGIRKRLGWYESVVSQTLDYWRTQAKVVRVDGVGTREEVAARIQEVIDAA